MFMETLANINFALGLLFFFAYGYQMFYILVPFFRKHRKHKEPIKKNRLAILVSARNEELVIGNLLESIEDQDYDKSLLKVFVVADNCTDRTADIARGYGAVVYERFDKTLIGKGYALDWLLDKIKNDGYWDDIDGFLVFDADNVLTPNYITEMNKTFSDGYEAATSYRNSKNYGDNWISAGYGLWYLRESKYLHNSRMLMNTSCAISGTGFLVSKRLIEKHGGWKFFLLTEDIEFSICNVVEGERIGYCDGAELYDEQPVTFKQSWKQRLRWSKGFFQVFGKYGWRLAKGIFKGKSFACFDMIMNIMPAFIITNLSIIVSLISIIVGLSTGLDFAPVLRSFTGYLTFTYCIMFTIGTITTITEWKKIRCANWKKIFFLFTFPIFMFTYLPISAVALFKKVRWEPIEHTRSKSLKEIVSDEEGKK